MMDCYNDETKVLIKKGINPISFPGLHLSITSDDSIAINFDEEPKVIISAAGMCDAGRVRHHLKHNLWRPECTILFAGYQAVGTLGRSIVEGREEVKLFGESIEVRAKIEKIEGISGHADQTGLLELVGNFMERPTHVFVVQGFRLSAIRNRLRKHPAYLQDFWLRATGSVRSSCTMRAALTRIWPVLQIR